MPETHETAQEAFWAGGFGDEYISRNRDASELAGRTYLWSSILGRASGIGSAVEFGANIGFNIHALRRLLPAADLSAIEINAEAAEQLRNIDGLSVHHGSILEPQVDRAHDLAFTVGVLIHINPDVLPAVYANLYAASSRYVVVAEYYNPSPMVIPYRGHNDRLFKRDFAGEMLDRFDDLRLVDYGFCYHRDPNFPLDDITWFLMEKRAA
ncbi:MAG: pseudaminic acid biosynthesis-associated methylase [Alphaproteobacteria bacterium]|nr:pseudaminic acid biosynthesis-associated methylase [Alphaproteobacteria bacterium]